MTNLLLKLFIKDYQNTADARVRQAYGKLAGVVGIVTNLLLFAFKITAGLLFHSIAVVADAVNNLSDSASSIITLVGFKLSGKPADEKHPYGHARMEYLSGLIVSFIILILGVQLAQSSFEKVISPEEAEFSVVTVAVLAVSILLKLWQGSFYKKMGRKIDSTTLEATAADSLNDVIATAAILAGVIVTKMTGFNLDGYMGLVVAVFIVITGIKLIMATSNPLLGLAPTQELVNEIYDKIMGYEGIIGLHDLNVHNYGPSRCFASVHCEVPASQDIMVSHDIVDNIERDFLKDMNIHMVIHLDPVVTDDERTNLLKGKVRELLLEISPELSMHDFRVVWGQTHSNLIFDVLVPFDFQLGDEALMGLVEQKVKLLDSRYNTVLTVDHSYVPKQDERNGER